MGSATLNAVKCITFGLCGWFGWCGKLLPRGIPRLPVERRGSAGSRGIHKEPYLAALCAELAAAHFQFEELTLYRFELFVVGVCTELL